MGMGLSGLTQQDAPKTETPLPLSLSTIDISLVLNMEESCCHTRKNQNGKTPLSLSPMHLKKSREQQQFMAALPFSAAQLKFSFRFHMCFRLQLQSQPFKSIHFQNPTIFQSFKKQKLVFQKHCQRRKARIERSHSQWRRFLLCYSKASSLSSLFSVLSFNSMY